ncbi:MAG: hypothetical protein HXX08_10100 [Chloroflexi bacterium]|uniref:Uncharacterized protein n=1 Tax=Candidatus Chlorohelix allophototropha TaxID=3003348 RepID=A0A8T7M207_9CHLR|nr:hypothetical protein [Chloroflexota bacterium]WJW65596.1 hypothetical protein OZ401_001364 [Chloroflexota bacterium L227-S17]
MKKTFTAMCVYEDGSKDEAVVIVTSEGTIFQVAWEISNGEKDRAVIEAESAEEAFAIWCEDNGFVAVS